MAVSDPSETEIYIRNGDIELPNSMKNTKARIDKIKISQPKIVDDVVVDPYYYPEDRSMSLLQRLQRGKESLLEINDEAWFNAEIIAEQQKAERLARRKSRK